MEKKYKGVYKKKWHGRTYYSVRFYVDGERFEFGNYSTEKECAKAYDLFVIKNNLPRKTNFFKKVLV
jgi:hypothetical protein